MRILIGLIIGVLAYHYFPTQIQDVASKAGEIVHQGADAVADATKPKSTVDEILEKVK
jgi:hypothetical protein